MLPVAISASRFNRQPWPFQQPAQAKWRIEGGCDDDGEPLDVVIVFTGRGLIVTVF